MSKYENKYLRAKSLVDGGASVRDAVLKAKISLPTYYGYKRKDAKKDTVIIYPNKEVERAKYKPRKSLGGIFVLGPMTIEQAREVIRG